jgi:peptidoglycan hydrolase CwlO-like protein
MKINITKKSSTSLATKVVLAVISLVIMFAAPIQMIQTVFADQFDDILNARQQDLDRFTAQAAKLAAHAITLQAAVEALQNQADVIQAKINVSQAQYDKLIAQIADTEQKIIDNKNALGITIANMYVDGNITPIEMLAGSKNIGDYLDKQEYQSSIRSQLTSTISKIKDLKVQLDKQKADVKSVLDKQKADKASLVATQDQQQYLLNQTKGEEAAYQQLIADTKQKMAEDKARREAYYRSLLSNGGNGGSGTVGDFIWQNLTPNNGAGGCSGGYPFCQEQDTVIDPWQLYNRECVSYVAWALQYKFHKNVSGFNGQGNAYEWPFSAAMYSGAVRVFEPQAGDAVIIPANPNFAPLGHAMIVEFVNGDWIHISQYNYYGTGQYSEMDIKNSGVIFLRFPNQ